MGKKREQIRTVYNSAKLTKSFYKVVIDPITGIPKNMTGRPPKFTSPEQIIEIAQQYFQSCWKKIKRFDRKTGITTTEWKQVTPYTITGLAVALGMSRITLLDYERNNRGTTKGDKFCEAVHYLKNICQKYAEERLYTGNSAGPIFNLCNNYARWQQRTTQEISGPEGTPIKTETTVNMSAEEATKLYMQEIKK